MPGSTPKESDDGEAEATIARPSNPGGSAAQSTSSHRYRRQIRNTWLDRIEKQLDDPSTGLQERIVNLVRRHYPGTPTGINRRYHGSFNLSIVIDFYDGPTSAKVSTSLASMP